MASALCTFLLAAVITSCLGQSTTGTRTSSPSGAASTTSSSITCASGLHLIVARGSGEPKGMGMGVVAGNVTEAVPRSTVAAVDYPATFDAYVASEHSGVVAMTAMITAHLAACPGSKIPLLGYSQGGQVAMDVVCGTSEALFAATPGLSDAFKDNSERVSPALRRGGTCVVERSRY